MTTFGALSAVLAVGLVTYVSRAGLILALADRPLSPRLERGLRNVGPAVLSALVVTLLAGSEGASGISIPEVAAIAAAALVAWKTKNLIATLTAGMVVVWIVAAFF